MDARRRSRCFIRTRTHSGVNVAVRNYGGGLKEIAQQVESRNYEWDVVDLEIEDAAAGCRQGLLERLDNIQLPPGIDGAAARRDFVPGRARPLLGRQHGLQPGDRVRSAAL